MTRQTELLISHVEGLELKVNYDTSHLTLSQTSQLIGKKTVSVQGCLYYKCSQKNGKRAEGKTEDISMYMSFKLNLWMYSSTAIFSGTHRISVGYTHGVTVMR